MEYTRLRNRNRGYMKLEVWQKAIELYELIWKFVYQRKPNWMRLMLYWEVENKLLKLWCRA